MEFRLKNEQIIKILLFGDLSFIVQDQISKNKLFKAFLFILTRIHSAYNSLIG